MSHLNTAHWHTQYRRELALLAVLVMTVIAFVLLGVFYVAAVEYRLIRPPAFSFQYGPVIISAPCPKHGGFICDESTPFYTIWRGEFQRDGSVSYRQLFFMYLQPVRKR